MADRIKPGNDIPAAETPSRHDSALSYYTQVAASEARRFRRGFTSENVAATLKTLAWVVPLTMLIWVYAEREQLATDNDVSVSITVKSMDPTRVVTLLRPAEGNITCSLQGSRSKLDQVRDLLQPHGNVPPITVEIGQGTPLGQSVPIPLQARIQDNPKFTLNGVSVLHCLPENLIIAVDRLEDREVPVEAPPNLPSLQSATFNPPTVRLRGPHLILDRLSKEGHLAVFADIVGLSDLNSPGQHVLNAVPILPPDPDPNITLTPSAVQATLNVKEADVTYEVHNLPVLLLAPGSLLDQYKVKYEPILPSVSVTGPPSKIDELQRGDAHPFAVLEVSTEDIKNPKPAKLRILDLPAGVKVSPGLIPEATFTVVDRGG